jgi:hypothetical protein
MKSISVQYQELKEGKINRHQFLHNARMLFPNFVTNHNSFEDSVKILKNKGLLNEGDAVKGTPDKAPSYDYPTQPGKYKKVVQEPEVDEQDGIYPATTVTDIPKEEVSKPIKSKNRPDGLEPIKDKDKKNEMKKIRIVKESKKNLTESTLDTAKQAAEKLSKEELKALWNAWEKRGEKVFGGMLTDPEYWQKSLDSNANKKLKEIIKKMVSEIMDEIGPAGMEAAGNPEEEASIRGSLIRKEYEIGDESDDAPDVRSAANSVVDMIKTRIETNDIDLKWKESDVIDTFFNFQDRIGHRYSDEEYNDIIDSAMDKLKAQGYKMEP